MIFLQPSVSKYKFSKHWAWEIKCGIWNHIALLHTTTLIDLKEI